MDGGGHIGAPEVDPERRRRCCGKTGAGAVLRRQRCPPVSGERPAGSPSLPPTPSFPCCTPNTGALVPRGRRCRSKNALLFSIDSARIWIASVRPAPCWWALRFGRRGGSTEPILTTLRFGGCRRASRRCRRWTPFWRRPGGAATLSLPLPLRRRGAGPSKAARSARRSGTHDSARSRTETGEKRRDGGLRPRRRLRARPQSQFSSRYQSIVAAMPLASGTLGV